uniref:RNA-dependent RNA polymerase n=1 Tax=Tianjin Botou tick virus 1 TaxID=2972068 RepID=A0A9E7V212_9VIRU|nr:MAG: RNA-dependent RNA polymerase [Tianjin Botou tick virus 1]
MPVPASKSNQRLAGQLKHVRGQFDSFVELLEQMYGISLVRPQVENLKELSSFCQGLICRDINHPWRGAVKRLSARSRFGIAHSLFLFRKRIPKEKPQVEDYAATICTPQGAPDPDFLSFARNETRRVFGWGWDRKYQDYCLTSSLPSTSCSEAGRSEGGSRGWDAESRWRRSSFCEYVLRAYQPANRGVSKVQAIETGGKWRIITIPPIVDNALRPLHKAMYSHLSHQSWLLRGDAKPSRFVDFTPREGEVFVSGDYESATDNLNSELQLAILDVLLERSYTVPEGIREHARSIYRSVLADGKGQVLGTQARGQLMGQLTSFPLLCLINYITFRYCIRRPVPVRINGDDIVFRATPDEVTRWERGVAKGGLRLSIGKTLVSSRAFTLNSTPFWSCPKGAQLVGYVRSSALFPRGPLSEQICSLEGRFYSASAGFGGRRRGLVRSEFLRQNQKPIHASRRSATRGLGLAVDEGMLRAVGMWHREIFYLEQVEEPPLPVLDTPVPSGWRRVPAHWVPDQDEWKGKWIDACVDHAWHGSFSSTDAEEDTKMNRIRGALTPYGLGSLCSTRVRSLLRKCTANCYLYRKGFRCMHPRVPLSRNDLWRYVNLRRNPSVFGRVRRSKGRMIWVETDLLPKRLQVVFVNSVVNTVAQ